MSMALANERTQMDDAPTSLLAPDEPQPVTVTNEGGRSPFVFVADHAGKYLPRRLQMLGLQQEDCERHIAWDIGAGAVSCLLGGVLGAVVTAKLFPPRHRLQPDAGLRDVGRRIERTHDRSRK